MANVVSMPRGSRPVLAPPPKSLPKHEADLWREYVAAYEFNGPAAYGLLQVALEAHARCREAKEAIDRDGLLLLDRYGKPRQHPLVHCERDARAAYLAALKHLNLDI